MNAPLPSRNGQQQTKITHDPQRQVLCPACGGASFRPRIHVFRLPGQVIGTVDLTMDQLLVCEGCSDPVNIATAPLRKDVEKIKPA